MKKTKKFTPAKLAKEDQEYLDVVDQIREQIGELLDANGVPISPASAAAVLAVGAYLARMCDLPPELQKFWMDDGTWHAEEYIADMAAQGIVRVIK